jgi:hypothetical protein
MGEVAGHTKNMLQLEPDLLCPTIYRTTQLFREPLVSEASATQTISRTYVARCTIRLLLVFTGDGEGYGHVGLVHHTLYVFQG